MYEASNLPVRTTSWVRIFPGGLRDESTIENLEGFNKMILFMIGIVFSYLFLRRDFKIEHRATFFSLVLKFRAWKDKPNFVERKFWKHKALRALRVCHVNLIGLQWLNQRYHLTPHSSFENILKQHRNTKIAQWQLSGCFLLLNISPILGVDNFSH